MNLFKRRVKRYERRMVERELEALAEGFNNLLGGYVSLEESALVYMVSPIRAKDPLEYWQKINGLAEEAFILKADNSPNKFDGIRGKNGQLKEIAFTRLVSTESSKVACIIWQHLEEAGYGILVRAARGEHICEWISHDDVIKLIKRGVPRSNEFTAASLRQVVGRLREVTAAK